MRLLIFVVLNLACLYAEFEIFKADERKVLGELEEDAKGLGEKITILISNLKKLKPDDAEAKTVTERLNKFIDEKIPAEFAANLTTGYFSNEITTKALNSVRDLLKEKVIEKALLLCGDACKNPFEKISSNDLETLNKAIERYSSRTTEPTALQKVKSNLGKFGDHLGFFHSYLKDELRTMPEEAKRLLSTLPMNISLPNMADFINGTHQQPGVNNTLQEMINILQNAGAALNQCREKISDKHEPLCSMGTRIPFDYARDKSNIVAFENMVKKYNERPLAPDTVPTPVDPKNPSSNTTNVEATTATTTTKASDNNGGLPQPVDPKTSGTCCQLCLLPAMPQSQGNCQSGNQCNCGCSCNSGNTRGCRTQNKCCSSNNHCKDNCCEKGHHEDKKPVVHTEVINIPPAASSSSSPMVALVSAVSLIATLMR